jgi:type IV secretory pathway TrbD component
MTVPTYTPLHRHPGVVRQFAAEANRDVLIRLGKGVCMLGLGVLTWIALIGGAKVMVSM